MGRYVSDHCIVIKLWDTRVHSYLLRLRHRDHDSLNFKVVNFAFKPSTGPQNHRPIHNMTASRSTRTESEWTQCFDQWSTTGSNQDLPIPNYARRRWSDPEVSKLAECGTELWKWDSELDSGLEIDAGKQTLAGSPSHRPRPRLVAARSITIIGC
eukprot:311789-Rhodomonas_salina.3